MTRSPFSERVRRGFARRVDAYESMALLQRGMAWRLAGLAARHLRAGALPRGPCADLGAGTGLVGRALAAWGVGLSAPLAQLDLCSEALERNKAGPTLPWDLNHGLPGHLRGASLLTSSFALQWLDDPAAAVALWADHLAPGGALLLSVPTAGSFPEWRQAARQARLPCSALPLPAADALLRASSAAGLERIEARLLTFFRPSHRDWPPAAPAASAASAASAPQGRTGRPPASGALRALRALRAIGADATPQASLSPGDWRRLLAAWPPGGALSWEVLVLLARQPSAVPPCAW
jgi:malonyl-CoA O-methyltransferase